MRKKYILLLMLAVLFLVSCRGISEKDSESSSNKDVLLENETITGTQENTASEVDTEKYVIEYRGVVFKNYFYGYEHDAVYPTTNEIDTGYKDGTTANLYAFVMASHVSVDIEPQGEAETDLEYDVRREKAESEYVVNRALEMGLMVLPEYYYCSFQNEKLEKMFPETDALRPLKGRCVIIGTMEQIRELFQGTEPIDGVPWCLYAAVRPDWMNIMSEIGLSETEITEVHWGTSKYDDRIQEVTGTDMEVILTVPVIVSQK